MQEARPNIGDMIANGEISLLVNIPFGQETRGDSYHREARPCATASAT